jgi:hypothetical protein
MLLLLWCTACRLRPWCRLLSPARAPAPFLQDLQGRLDAVADPQARTFLQRCMASEEQRPSARDLLDDPFLQVGGAGVLLCHRLLALLPP